MVISATEFKARCLNILDRVNSQHETVTITKHGRVVARVVPASDVEDRPWLRLRSKPAEWRADPLSPAVAERDIDVLKK